MNEWGTCLTPSKFRDFGTNYPWMETFYKFMSEFCVSLTTHVSWPNLAKFARCKVSEKSSGIAHRKKHAPGTLFSPPFRPHLPDRAPNFVNVVGPWPGHVYRLWSGSAALCRTYSGKSQKSQYNIGFQPTITFPNAHPSHTWQYSQSSLAHR